MRAAVLQAPHHDLTFEQRPPLVPPAGHVLIQVHACGVCYSDVDLQRGHYGFAHFPVVPGHEVTGVVKATSDGVAQPAIGTRVGVPWLFSACGHCAQCVRGEEVLCARAAITGVTVDGGYAEYLVAPAAYVTPIPEGLDLVDAAPLLCAGLAVFNALRVADVAPGHRVAVLGFGGLGHLGVQYARAMGARVAVVTGSPDKQDEAYALGAERVIN